MNLLDKTKKHMHKIVITVTVLCLGVLLLPLYNKISPWHHVDGVPMLDRIMQFNQGTISIGQYLFTKHGNSMHTIVYAVAFLDNYFFNNIPVLMKLFTFIGFAGATIITVEVLYNKDNGLIKNILLVLVTVFMTCGLAYQLFLPFQIGLTFTRPIFMLIILVLIDCFIKEKRGITYTCVVFFACIAAALHGIGLMFAGSFVYLHLIHRQGVKRIIYSFFPAIFAVILQLTFNNGFGEVNSSGGSYLIRHFFSFLKCMFAYYATPFGLLKIPQRMLVAIGMVLFIFTALLLLYKLVIGLGFNRKLVFLPEKYRNLVLQYSIRESFITALLAISFLAALSSAIYAAARMDLDPSIAANPARYTLCSDRYVVYSIMPYIYIFWKIASLNISRLQLKLLRIVALFGAVLIVIGHSHYMINIVKGANQSYDLGAVGALTGISMETSLTNVVFPGYQSDWYWKDEVPNLLSYFQQNYGYIWGDMPRIGDHIDNSRKCQNIANITMQEYEVPDYQIFSGTTTLYPSTRYAAILDINNTVIGFVHIERKGGLFRGNDKKLYYDNKSYIKGFILSSAKASTNFKILVE